MSAHTHFSQFNTTYIFANHADVSDINQGSLCTRKTTSSRFLQRSFDKIEET